MTAMLLAVSKMDPGFVLFFFAVAFVLFVVAAIISRPLQWATLMAAGLACVTFVWAWNALAAT
jgi:hypothetical protein